MYLGRMINGVALLVLLSFSSLTFADAVQDLRTILAKIQSFQADFKQQTLDSFGQPRQIINGTMLVKKPGFLRWQTEGEYAQLVVADGENIWIYDEDLENVTIKPMGKEMSETPALLLSGDAATIANDFSVEKTDSEFVLIPKDSSQLFDRLILQFEQGALQRMAINDASGLTTEIQFLAVQNNPDIDDTLFVFETPQGVDIIDSRP